MFCVKCGAKNDDNAKFCVECGNKLEHVIPARQKVQQGDASYVPSGNQQGEIPRFIPSDRTEKRKNTLFRNMKPVPVVVTVLLVLAVVLLGKMLFSGGQEKKLIKNFVKAEMEGNAKTLINMLPDEVVRVAEKDGMDKKELTDQMDEMLQSVQSSLKSMLGEDWNYSYKIQKMEKMSQEEIQEKEKDYADEECELDIKEGKTVTVELTIKGKDIENSQEIDIGIIKVGKKWYLDAMSLSDLLY